MARFGHFLLTNQERITEHWVGVVDRSPEVSASEDLTYRQLLDRLPALCGELGSFLKRPDVPAIREQAARDASAHGSKRWHQGYSLSELIREICLLRNDILDVWLSAFAAETDGFDDQAQEVTRKMVRRFFDDMIIESAVQFTEEKTEVICEVRARLLKAENSAQEAKSNFLRNVSHALREPLAALAFAAEALTTERGLSAEGKENLLVILRNVKLEAVNVDELLLASELNLGEHRD